MLENRVKSQLAAGGYALGACVTFVRVPAVMRMIAEAGYDFAFIDMKSSAFSFELVSDMCETSRAANLVPVVRPYAPDGDMGNRILDLGAMGLIHFDVTTRAQVDGFIRSMYYPPIGARGQTAGAPFDYQRGSKGEAQKFVNDNMLLVIQIESKAGVDRIDEILQGGGVDVVAIGRGDLAKDYGIPGQRRHPRVLEAVDKVIEACRRHNVASGAGTDSREDAEDLIRRGMRYLSNAVDRDILMGAFAEGHETLRSLVQRQPA